METSSRRSHVGFVGAGGIMVMTSCHDVSVSKCVIVLGNHGCKNSVCLGFVWRSKFWGPVLCGDLGGVLWRWFLFIFHAVHTIVVRAWTV